MSECKEFFLDDIVEISVYPVSGCTLPIPFCVPNIQSMSNCTLSTPVLQIGNDSGMIAYTQDTISAKVTPDVGGNGIIYSYEITANVEEAETEIRTAYNNIGSKDHYVTLKKADGTLYLCYTLPNTFLFKSPVTVKGAETRQVAITLKSNSEFIPIALKEVEKS